VMKSLKLLNFPLLFQWYFECYWTGVDSASNINEYQESLNK
jgi:hypothetical protein